MTSSSQQRVRITISWVTLLALVGLVVFLVVYRMENFSFNTAAYAKATLTRSWSMLVNNFRIDSWLFWGPLLIIVITQRVTPAVKEQKILCTGFYHDLVWFLVTPVFAVNLVFVFRSIIKRSYENHLAFLTVNISDTIPLWLQIVFVILASDFLHWFAHLLKHKVRIFWYFHSVHHSQPELNVFTDQRVHPLERIITFVIRFLPLLALELRISIPLGIGWWLFTHWHTAAYHANIRSDYGVLKYLLVTPQSHRVHHSVEARHQDKNFGVFFSIWDHLFGTQYRDYEEYPRTGVAYTDFPLERRTTLKSLFITPIRQIVYPFKLIISTARPTRTTS